MHLQGNLGDVWGQQVQEKADTGRKAVGFKEESRREACRVGGLGLHPEDDSGGRVEAPWEGCRDQISVLVEDECDRSGLWQRER